MWSHYVKVWEPILFKTDAGNLDIDNLPHHFHVQCKLLYISIFVGVLLIGVKNSEREM